MWRELVVFDIMPNKYLISDKGEIIDKITNEHPKLYLEDVLNNIL